MRDDAVLRRALPLGWGLGRLNTSVTRQYNNADAPAIRLQADLRRVLNVFNNNNKMKHNNHKTNDKN